MPDTTKRMTHTRAPSRWQRIAWFIGLYLAGLAAVSLIAAGLRLLMEFTVI